MSRGKHIPVRTCVICRNRIYQNQLIRFVRNNDNTLIMDFKKKMPGRGVYVCNINACMKSFIDRYMKKTYIK